MSPNWSNSMDTNTQNRRTRLVDISRARAWWLLATAVAAALILGLGTLEAIRLLALPLAVFIFGITLAAALEPLVARLEKRVARVAATLIVYLVLMLFLGLLIWFIVPSLVNQMQELGSLIPDLIEQARQIISSLRGNFAGDSFTNALFSQLSSLGPTLLRLPLGITSALAMAILILFISFYVLLEAPGIWVSLLSLLPEERRAKIDQTGSDMSEAMGGYIRGTVINGMIVGFLTFLGLELLGVDFALVFGVMAGLLELIPVLGPIVAGIIIVSLTLLQSPDKALWVLIFWIVLEQTENHILVPNIMRSQTNISPLLSILALFAGGAVGGFLGALVAIPIAAALRVMIRQIIAPAVRERTGAEPVEEEEESA
jgi:predicted PurR-regulated permease PerM